MNKELIKDIQLAEEMAKVVNASDSDKTNIYYLYKKYVYANAVPPTSGCNTCNTSLTTYWVQVMKWLGEMRNLMENNK